MTRPVKREVNKRPKTKTVRLSIERTKAFQPSRTRKKSKQKKSPQKDQKKKRTTDNLEIDEEADSNSSEELQTMLAPKRKNPRKKESIIQTPAPPPEIPTLHVPAQQACNTTSVPQFAQPQQLQLGFQQSTQLPNNLGYNLAPPGFPPQQLFPQHLFPPPAQLYSCPAVAKVNYKPDPTRHKKSKK